MALNNALLSRMNAGQFDGKTRREQTDFKKLVARQCCKPHSRYRVRVQSEWAFY
ncbi:hypothetical protein NP590_03995 [Methylomonas sp. SURF-2]|uniref:Uncharacterized protein n=1 Tax=Methylomonas subterranea TaxID=2952225 RepID=A0ABT1TCS5_9GAMM|nr:hypothetical protein [Methylomonas sp. SURF-2]MCQ8103259.1 hypothetical protein [Methylomonas sp. SURF-2]